MKSKIVSAALLSLVFVISAFAVKPKPAVSNREIQLAADFNKIIVDNDLSVILVQDKHKSTITVSGDTRYIANVETSVVNGELKIYTKKYAGHKITVYVPVKNVSAIQLLNGSSVSADGVLNFPDLTVTINSECHVALNVLGKINIQSMDGCDFMYEKNEKYKVVTVAQKKENENVVTATR